MTLQQTHGSPDTGEAGAELEAFRRVRLNSDDEYIYANSGQPAEAITTRYAAEGDSVTVEHINSNGTFKIAADGALTALEPAYGGASGKISATPNGNPQFLPLDTTASDGQPVECITWNADKLGFRPGKVNTETLSGDKTISAADPQLQLLDPGGSGRNVDLPPEASSQGQLFVIANTADGSEVLTIRNDGGDTIATPAQNESAIVFCDGTTWVGLVGSSA